LPRGCLKGSLGGEKGATVEHNVEASIGKLPTFPGGEGEKLLTQRKEKGKKVDGKPTNAPRIGKGRRCRRNVREGGEKGGPWHFGTRRDPAASKGGGKEIGNLLRQLVKGKGEKNPKDWADLSWVRKTVDPKEGGKKNSARQGPLKLHTGGRKKFAASGKKGEGL